ncbi:MAG: hypothetical protein GY828_02485 [Candidatus Gracilibacteria bacterium]|nr:hypothetical protein [Candidatus Gracilibacteria bacterium]
MKKINDTLKSLGLNEKEIKIYLTSLSMGQTTASLLGKKAGIVRSTAQYTCNALVDKRLMNVTPQGNSFLYSPEPPAKIMVMANQEFDRVENKVKNVQSIMGDLLSLATPHAKLPKVKYYTGVDGVIDILEDIFTEKHMFYGVFNYVEDIHPDLNEYIQKKYVPRRIETKVPSKFLFNDNPDSQEYMRNNKSINRVTMSIPKGMFPFSIGLHIYSTDKVALYSMQRDDMTGIIIENKNIKESLLSMFKLAWNFSRNFPENQENKDIEI